MFFLSLTTWDNLGHFAVTKGALSEPYNPTHNFETVLYNVLVDHCGLPCVLPLSVHLDLEHLPDTLQRYLGPPTWTF